jgi:hypothetical protein
MPHVSLARVRRDDAASRAHDSEVARAAQAEIDRLTRHLNAQRGQLSNLAKALRLPEPAPGAVGRSSTADLGVALQQSAEATNRADVEARRAEHLAHQPALLPGFSPTGRNALVYSGWCLVGWLAQCALSAVAPETSFGVLAWSLCGLPALAFFAGYLTIATAGQPRIGGDEYPKNPRLGGVICFVGMPLAWLLLIAAVTFVRG